MKKLLKRLYRLTPRGRAEVRECLRLRDEAYALSMETINLGHVLILHACIDWEEHDDTELRERRRMLHGQFISTSDQADAMAERLGIRI